MITMIAAAAENNALGKNGEIPWHLPDDFRHFKKLTTGHRQVFWNAPNSVSCEIVEVVFATLFQVASARNLQRSFWIEFSISFLSEF